MKIRSACFVARAFPILLTSFLPFEASAQDACHNILTAGFYTEYATVSYTHLTLPTILRV